MSATPSASNKPKQIDGFDEWEVREAAGALKRAFEIKSKPKLLRAATKMLRKETAAAEKALAWSDKIK
jgi:hypothetical protein